MQPPPVLRGHNYTNLGYFIIRQNRFALGLVHDLERRWNFSLSFSAYKYKSLMLLHCARSVWNWSLAHQFIRSLTSLSWRAFFCRIFFYGFLLSSHSCPYSSIPVITWNDWYDLHHLDFAFSIQNKHKLGSALRSHCYSMSMTVKQEKKNLIHNTAAMTTKSGMHTAG